MRLMRFSFTICHVPGKDLATADTLSQTPVSGPTDSDTQLREESNAYIQTAILNIPATEKQLQESTQLIVAHVVGLVYSKWSAHTNTMVNTYYIRLQLLPAQSSRSSAIKDDTQLLKDKWLFVRKTIVTLCVGHSRACTWRELSSPVALYTCIWDGSTWHNPKQEFVSIMLLIQEVDTTHWLLHSTLLSTKG